MNKKQGILNYELSNHFFIQNSLFNIRYSYGY